MTDDADDAHTHDPEVSYSGARPTNGEASTPGFRPFPVQALPDVPGAYVEAVSEALDIAPALGPPCSWN